MFHAIFTLDIYSSMNLHTKPLKIGTGIYVCDLRHFCDPIWENHLVVRSNFEQTNTWSFCNEGNDIWYPGRPGNAPPRYQNGRIASV